MKPGAATRDHERVRQDGRAGTGRPELAHQRLVDRHPVGDIEEAAAAEEGGVQRGELVSLRLDAGEEVSLDQLGVGTGGLRQRHEDHAPLGKLGRDRYEGGRGSALAKRRPDVLERASRRHPIRLLERRICLEIQAFEVDVAPVLLALGVGRRHTLVDSE